jgi:hypothetical protein
MSERSLPFDKIMLVGVTGADSGVTVLLEDSSGNAVLIQATKTLPYGKSGYSVGCLAIVTSTGTLYQNQGTATSCSFSSFTRLATGVSGTSGSSGSSGA